MGDNRRMKHTSTHENQAAQELTRVSETQTSKGKTPSLLVSGKPEKLTRAQRQTVNKLARKAAEVKELAATAVPEAFRGALAANGVGTGKSVGPQLVQVTELLPSQQDRRHEIQQSRNQDIKLAHGRPAEYSEDEGDTLCAWIQGGGSLRSYSKNTGRSVTTVYRWMRESATFQTRYAQAHEDRADTFADEMIEIADAAGVNATIEDVAAAKLRVETRKWIASKLRPQKWGDKQLVEHVGAVSISINTKVKPPTTVLDVEDATPLLR